jgi:hypothetical protein
MKSAVLCYWYWSVFACLITWASEPAWAQYSGVQLPPVAPPQRALVLPPPVVGTPVQAPPPPVVETPAEAVPPPAIACPSCSSQACATCGRPKCETTWSFCWPIGPRFRRMRQPGTGELITVKEPGWLGGAVFGFWGKKAQPDGEAVCDNACRSSCRNSGKQQPAAPCAPARSDLTAPAVTHWSNRDCRNSGSQQPVSSLCPVQSDGALPPETRWNRPLTELPYGGEEQESPRDAAEPETSRPILQPIPVEPLPTSVVPIAGHAPAWTDSQILDPEPSPSADSLPPGVPRPSLLPPGIASGPVLMVPPDESAQASALQDGGRAPNQAAAAKSGNSAAARPAEAEPLETNEWPSRAEACRAALSWVRARRNWLAIAGVACVLLGWVGRRRAAVSKT